MLHLAGIISRVGIRSRLSAFSQIVKLHARSYAQPRKYARGKSLVRQPRQSPERDVWVDPFKTPPPPRPDYRVLRRPLVFAGIVMISADYVADYFVAKRTSVATTRAERNAESTWTILPIIGANVVVFCLWRVFPSFVHRIGGLLVPYAPTPSQLVVSTFSHQEIWHLFLNQVAFYSFGTLVCDTIGREHFLALYLQAACFSSIASISATQFLTSRGVYDLSHLSRGSLGASGVVYSMLGLSAVIYPDMGVGIILLPVSFPIKYCFPALCAIDTVGLIAKWSRFDHVCHVYLSLGALLTFILVGRGCIRSYICLF